jgi:iron complex outermembrane receptor protein
MKKIYHKIMLFGAAIVFPLWSMAQDLNISGRVTDSNGDPVAGASVVVKGTATGVTTGINGDYDIGAPADATLTFSFLGMGTQEEAVDGRGRIDVIMGESDQSIEEVVVVAVGYGTARKADLTGAITSVQAKDMRQGVINSAEQLLQGKVAGLTVIKNGGNPTESAALRLRGGTSLSASNAPLVVVDGIPGVDINTVSPASIVAIDVLKDASAAAIYGSRGANGVILVTTSRQKAGRHIEYNGYAALGYPRQYTDVLTASEYRDFHQKNATGVLPDKDFGANTDWQKELQQNSISQSHNVSFAQSGDGSGMQASINYLNNEGVMKHSRLERLQGSMAGYVYGLNNRLRLDAGLNATADKTEDVDMSMFNRAYLNNPTVPVKDESGKFNTAQAILGRDGTNVVESMENRNDQGTRKRLLGYGKAELEIISGLKATANASYEYGSWQDYYYIPMRMDLVNPNAADNNGRRELSDTYRKQIETYLTYEKKFADRHNVNVMAGYSYQDLMSEGFSASRRTFATDEFLWNNLGAGTDAKQGDVASSKSSSKLASFFARANYNFDHRYMLTATIRRDGSSKFGANNKWGTFPSVSAAWRISEESFMQNTKSWLGNLKLRAGYGITGSQNGIAEYKSLATLGATSNFYNPETGQYESSYGYTSNPNFNLKWEETSQTDIGLDFTLLGRINVTLDWYYKLTSDLLYTYDVPTPPYLYRQIMANVGSLSNTGIELALNANIVRSGDFTLDGNLTLAHNRQVVEKLSNEFYHTDKVYKGELSGMWDMGVQTQVLQEGYPVGTFIGLKNKGITADGKFDVARDEGGNAIKVAANENYVILGDAQPALTFGLGFNAGYRWFDFSVQTYGMLGQKILNAQAMQLSGTSRISGGYNLSKKWVNYGALEDTGPVWSDFWLEDGSFLRLQTVTLGFTLPRMASLKTLGIERVRLYVTGENLLTLTKYTGMDPEVSIDGIDSPGIDRGNQYSMPRTVSFGLNLTF